MDERELLLKLWDESWTEGIWIAPWKGAVESLTPEQAAWRPAPERHCIWQLVNHVSIWREYTLAKLAGGGHPTRDEVLSGNFAMPDSPTDAEWHRALERLHASHLAMAAALAQPTAPLDRLRYHLGHDCYHLGQIMYVRALQG